MEISEMIKKIRYSYDTALKMQQQFSQRLQIDSEAFFTLNDDSSEDEIMLQEIMPPKKDIPDRKLKDKFNSL